MVWSCMAGSETVSQVFINYMTADRRSKMNSEV